MGKLNIGVEIRDFDLERMGFSLSVLDETKKRQSSEAYLRMTLTELNVFLKALKTARDDIDVSTVEPSGVSKCSVRATPSGARPRSLWRRNNRPYSTKSSCKKASASRYRRALARA
jgi:hypothetical protein